MATTTVIGDPEQNSLEATVNYIKGSAVVYTKEQCPPPSITYLASITKDVTVTAQLSVAQPALQTYVTESILQTTGAVLWQVERGITSIYRCGFIPINAQSFNTFSNVNGAPSAGCAGARGLVGPWLAWGFGLQPYPTQAGGSVTTYTYGTIAGIVYTQEMLVPYGSDSEPNDVIQIQPNLATDITFTRVFSGQIALQSSTVAIGSTALTGTFSAAAIEDTRDLAQSNQGAFAISRLMQSADNRKDAVMQIPVEKGVCAVVGPDINPDFTNPNQGNVLRIEGNYSVWPQTAGLVFSTGTSSTVNWSTFPTLLGTGSPYCAAEILSYWVTPWSTQMTSWATPISGTATTGAPSVQLASPVTITTIQTSPIAETGTLSIKFQMQTAIVLNAIGTGALTMTPQQGTDICSAQFQFSVFATHVFARCKTDGQVYYQCFQEHRILQNSCAGYYNVSGVSGWTGPNNLSEFGTYAGSPQFQVPNSGNVLEFDPQQFRTSFTSTGKYMGTKLSVAFGFIGGNSAVFNPPTTAGSWTNFGYQVTCYPPTIYTAAKDIDVLGNVGPVRLLRWDNVSYGQQVNVSGKLWCEAVPSANLAPYVKDSIMNVNRWCRASAQRLCAALYNGNSPFKRIWVLSDWVRFCTEIGQNLTLSDIERYAATDKGIATELYNANLLNALTQATGGFARANLSHINPTGAFAASGGFKGLDSGANFGAAGQFGACGPFSADGGFSGFATTRRGREDY